MTPSLFVDSWGWLTLANEKEEFFKTAGLFYENEVQSGTKIVTTDYILDEVCTFLFAKAPAVLAVKYLTQLWSSCERGFIHLERIGADRFERTWKMRLKYRDHIGVSFTDFTSFIVMQDLGIHRVLTNDRHFEEVNLGFQRVPANF